MRRSAPRTALGVLLGLAGLAAPPAARGDAAQDAMRLQLLSPAISGDGKTVAIVSLDPGDGPGASGSLALFDAGGALWRRLPLWAPQRDPRRAQTSYREATRLMDEAGFRRMGRLTRHAEKTIVRHKPGDPAPRFEGLFSHGDYGVTVTVTGGTLKVEAKRGKRTLGPWTVAFATPPAACPAVAGYSVSPARAGLQAASRLLALSVVVEDADGNACFSHEAVFPLK
ncbi:MAG TPA: hypothetical protein VGQ83_21105 [Polyangia bacterium]|jgi:hypothetical protein